MESRLRQRRRVVGAAVAGASLVVALGVSLPAAAATPPPTGELASSVRALSRAVGDLAEDLAEGGDVATVARHDDELGRLVGEVHGRGRAVAADIAGGRLATVTAAAALAAPHLDLLASLGRLSAAAPGLPTLPPLPPIPEPLQPAVGVVVPIFDETVGRVCGLAKLGLSLGGGLAPSIVAQILTVPAAADALKPAVQPGISALTQVLNLACNSLPVRQFRTTCDADGQLAGVLPTTWPEALGFLGGVIGPPTSLVPAPIGAAVDSVTAAERAAGTEPSASGALGSQLGCTTVDRFDGGTFDLAEPDLGGAADEPPAVALSTSAFSDTGGLAPEPLSIGALRTGIGADTAESGADDGEIALRGTQPLAAVPDGERPWLRLVLLCLGLLGGAAALLGPGARSLLGHVR